MNPCHALRTTALALALCVAAPQASAGADRTKPAPTPVTPALYFEGVEDTAIDVVVDAGANTLSVAVEPKNGVLVTDVVPMRYIPGPDFNGIDEIDFLMVSPTGKESTMRAQIMVRPVNDAPSFTAGSGRAHQRREAGAYGVDAWAKAVSAGPLDEVRTQWVGFEASVVNDPAGVVTSVSVDGDGTLKYALSGRVGVSEWALSLHDSGGTADGGQNSSAAQILRIGVGQTTDLTIKVLRPQSEELGPNDSYQILVMNVGKIDVAGARVVDLFGTDGNDGSWQCVSVDGGECGASSGAGFIDQRVDLPHSTGVLFSVTTSRGFDRRNVVFVQPPDHVIDIYLPNNEAGH
jgi:hypothetical protein